MGGLARRSAAPNGAKHAKATIERSQANREQAGRERQEPYPRSAHWLPGEESPDHKGLDSRRPGDHSPQARLAEQVVRASRCLEGEEPEPTLDALATEAGLSRAHFQRAFKRVVGVTPKHYARTRRKERLRGRLARAATVTEAIYDAGFGSSSLAYEGDELGMTPSVYRKGAAHYEGRENMGFGVLTSKQRNTMFSEHLDHHLRQFGV